MDMQLPYFLCHCKLSLNINPSVLDRGHSLDTWLWGVHSNQKHFFIWETSAFAGCTIFPDSVNVQVWAVKWRKPKYSNVSLRGGSDQSLLIPPTPCLLCVVGLTLNCCQTPTYLLSHFPSTTGQGRKYDGKTHRSRKKQGHILPFTIAGKTDSTWGELI